jgi:hypothetical protein
MVNLICKFSVLVLVIFSFTSFRIINENGWIKLFNGKSLNGWKANEDQGTFTIQKGVIRVNGARSHLFYMGSLMNHAFKNFELKVKVMTTPGSNSGIFFHTSYQDSGWLNKGFEVQINNSHGDWRRTGSIYGIKDLKDVFIKDNEWFNIHIIVNEKKVIVKLNDKLINEYTQPENAVYASGNEERKFSAGTFALQGHDPKSMVLFKEILVKVE